MRARHKANYDFWFAQKDATIEALKDRVKPCCPLGCERELVYKDYLYQAQATWYKKFIKEKCGKSRAPEPTEKELQPYVGLLSAEELEALED